MKKTMKLALAIADTHALPSAFVVFRGFRESIPKAACLGYDGVELALKTAEEVDRDQLAAWLRETGLKVSCISTGQVFADLGLMFTDADPANRARLIEIFEGLIDLAADFGRMVNIGRVRGGIGKEPPQEAEARFIDMARTLCDYAARKGVTLLIEPVNRYEIDFVNNVAEGVQLINRVGRSNLKLMPDVFHMNIEDATIGGELARHIQHIGYLHLADSNRLAPGWGHTDFDDIFRQLAQAGYEGWVSVEILPKPNPDTAARQAAVYLRPRIDQYNEQIRSYHPMKDKKQHAHELLQGFKGDSYNFGMDCFSGLGAQVAQLGRRALVVIDGHEAEWAAPLHEAVRETLRGASVALAADFIPGAAPNAPHEDVFRIAKAIRAHQPDVVVAVGGGSGIDAVKAATAYSVLGDRYPDLTAYFGAGQISKMLNDSQRRMLPLAAAQLAAGSAAHLTKYSNITFSDQAQKLLIIDEAVIPLKATFDYRTTCTMPPGFTMDGGLDGIAHCQEVYYGAPADKCAGVRTVCLLGIEMIVGHLPQACRDGGDLDAREALGLGTDLGGYAIMLGGTNGAHLTSFSLVDILSHGRACAIMNPYYTMFFAPTIEDKVRDVGSVYKRAGYTHADLDRLHGRDLGRAVAEAMVNLSVSIGFPTRLADVPGFTEEHLRRALAAAKDPKLESKLKNMPVPLAAETVDEYMGAVLEAAKTGNFDVIKNMPL